MKIIEINNFSNSYLLLSKKLNILIDASNDLKAEKIIQEINKNKIKKLDYIIITHAHSDHIKGLYSVLSFFEFKPKVLCHEFERKYVEGIKFIERNFLEKIFRPKIKKVYAEGIIEERLKISKNIEIIHTPGHTDGSISVYVKNFCIFVGDLLIRNKFGNVDISDEINSDIDLIKESIKKILNFDFKKIYFGHGKSGNKKEVKNFYKNF
ncbi:MAG: MBL fold metallo-hydrolase [Candidatus Aenigmatarchaeota archaeon]